MVGARHIRPSGVQNLQNSGFIFRFSLLPALSTVSTSLSSLIYVTYVMLYWTYTMSAHTPVLYLNCPSLHPSLLSAPFLSILSALQCLCSPYASAFGDFFFGVYLALGYTRRPIFIWSLGGVGYAPSPWTPPHGWAKIRVSAGHAKIWTFPGPCPGASGTVLDFIAFYSIACHFYTHFCPKF